MSLKVVYSSDISGDVREKEELGILRVTKHPKLYGARSVELHALPKEVDELLNGSFDVVECEWTPPGGGRAQRVVMTHEAFAALRDGLDDYLVSAAISAPREPQHLTPKQQRRARIPWASVEYAGRPHKGIVSKAEAETVRDNLDVVNRNLAANGIRTIDPNDEAMRVKYGL